MAMNFSEEDTSGSLSRTLSLLVALAYVVAGYWDSGAATALSVMAFLIIPLACIWFPDTLANMTGFFFRGQYVDRESPEIWVWFMGWVLLFLPVIAAGLSCLIEL